MRPAQHWAPWPTGLIPGATLAPRLDTESDPQTLAGWLGDESHVWGTMPVLRPAQSRDHPGGGEGRGGVSPCCWFQDGCPPPPPRPAAPSGPSFTWCGRGMQTFRPPPCLNLLGCEMGTVGESVWGTGGGESRTHRAEVPRARSLDGNAPLFPSLLELSTTRATGRCTPRRPRPCCGAARGGTSSRETRAASPVSARQPRPAPLLPQMPQPPVQSNGMWLLGGVGDLRASLSATLLARGCLSDITKEKAQ